MYSNNDFRSYSENHLEHASAYGNFKFPGGKNTPEYNHAYYIKNLWRWGVKGADALKGAAQSVLDKTDIDEKLTEAAKEAGEAIRDTGRAAVNKARDVIGFDERERRDAAARARRNTPSRQADYAAERTQRDYDRTILGRAENARNAARSAASSVRRNAEGAARSANRAVRNAGAAARNASRSAANNVRDFVGYDERERRDASARARRNTPSRQADYAAERAQRDYDRTLLGRAENARNAVSGAARRVLDSTDLDERAVSAAKSANRAVRNAGRSAANAVRDAVGFDERERRDAAARARRNTPSRQADYAAERTQRDYDRTILGRAEKVTSAASDLKDRATKAASRAVNDAVRDVTNTAKDFLGYDERTRRDAAARARRNTPSRQADYAAERTQRDYDRTPLGVAEKAYNTARDAFDKAVDIYGEGTKGAKRAADRVSTAAENVVKEARDAAMNLTPSGREQLSREQRSAARTAERLANLSREQRSAAREHAENERISREQRSAARERANNEALSREQRSAARERANNEALSREQRSRGRRLNQDEQESANQMMGQINEERRRLAAPSLRDTGSNTFQESAGRTRQQREAEQDRFDRVADDVANEAARRLRFASYGDPERFTFDLITYGVSKAGQAIRDYIQKAEQYGADSQQARKAYNDAISDVTEAARRRENRNNR